MDKRVRSMNDVELAAAQKSVDAAVAAAAVEEGKRRESILAVYEAFGIDEAIEYAQDGDQS